MHSLSVCFGQYTPLFGIVALLEPLQRYRSLTSLDIDMQPVLRVTRSGAAKTEDALQTTLAIIASHTQLTSLALHCPADIAPIVHVLRRLCSSVRQLSYLSTSYY